jgi:hypothetical protein
MPATFAERPGFTYNRSHCVCICSLVPEFLRRMIIALVVGWQNADRWAIRQLMLVYSIAFGLAIVLGGTGRVMLGSFQLQQ